MTAQPGCRLSAVVVARDEAAMLPGCLRRLRFADEVVVVVDERSRDATQEVAERCGVRVFVERFEDFSQLKNSALARASGEWMLVVDADERVTLRLQEEIVAALDGPYDAYSVARDNYFFAQQMRWGGWPERMVRLFRRGAAHYEGAIHEELQFTVAEPRIGRLDGSLAHFTHRCIAHNLTKTANFGDVQARELLAAGHPPVQARTFAGVITRELWRRLVRGRAHRDGMPGIVEALYQPFSLFTVYVRLWELQQQPSLEQRYLELEDEIDEPQPQP